MQYCSDNLILQTVITAHMLSVERKQLQTAADAAAATTSRPDPQKVYQSGTVRCCWSPHVLFVIQPTLSKQ